MFFFLILPGRPNFFTSYGKDLAYRLYVETHFYPALTILFLYSWRLWKIKDEPDIFTSDEPPLKLLLSVVVLFPVYWICAPILFCPQTTSVGEVLKDWGHTCSFVFTIKVLYIPSFCKFVLFFAHIFNSYFSFVAANYSTKNLGG